MPTILRDEKAITTNSIINVELQETTPASMDGRRFVIKTHNIKGDRVLSEEIVEVTNSFIATQDSDETELFYYLIQFRGFLPKSDGISRLTSNTPDVFKFPDWPRTDKIFTIGHLIGTYFRNSDERDFKLEPDSIRNSIRIEYHEIFQILDYYSANQVVKGYELGSTAVTSMDSWEKRLKETLKALGDCIDRLEKPEGRKEESVTIKADAEIVQPDSKIDVSSICQVPMWDEKICARQIIDKEEKKCICHSSDDHKDLTAFAQELDLLLEGNKLTDFTGFYFPVNAVFPNIKSVKTEMIFNKALVKCSINLSQAKFIEPLTIKNSTFYSGMVILDATFEGPVTLIGITSLELVFIGSTFKDSLRLDSIAIGGGDSLTRKTPGGVKLVSCNFDQPEKVSIRNLYLKDIFLRRCDVSNISISNIRFFKISPQYSDFKIGDELELGDKVGAIRYKSTSKILTSPPNEIIESYQQLQKSVLKAKNHIAAGHLHYNEMELERKKSVFIGMEKPRPRYKLLLKFAKYIWRNIISPYFWYKLLAKYCESTWRPIWMLFTILFCFTALTTLWLDKYDIVWAWDLPGFVSSIPFWWGKFVSNLGYAFYLNGDVFNGTIISDSLRFVYILQKIVVVIMVSFIVIAFRRRFKRY